MLNYGMSTRTLSERMGLSMQDAQNVVNGYYNGLSGVKQYTDESQKMLRDKGYVTDLWGRRRRIPDAQLEDYEVKVTNNANKEFNPLIGAVEHENEFLSKRIEYYKDKLKTAKWKADVDKIANKARLEGISIKNNKGFISRALRQCLNARIQGSAASMTKRAMILIDNDKELNDLGFKLLVTVHDEVFGTCPRDNSKKAAERLSQVMIDAANEQCNNVVWSCDGYAVSRWYEDELSAEVLKDYNKLLKKGIDNIKSLQDIKNKYSMINSNYVEQMCNEEYEINTHNDI